MRIIYSVIILSLLLSCKKDPGKGGSSSINGEVLTLEYNKKTKAFVRMYSSAEANVYIVYGNDNSYGDRVRTNNYGKFTFNYLTKGDYKLYVYSDNLDNSNTITTVEDIVKIGSNGTSVNVPTLEVIKIVETGNASVSGKLFAFDYNSELTILKDTFYLVNEYVYIALKNDSTYFNRIKTFYDGSYVFSSLLPGEYEVYAYSKALTPSGIVAKKKEFEIIEYNQNIILPRIEVIK